VGLRQARLRNEYAAWYPSIAVNIWIRASTVARAVARQLLEERQGEPWDLGPRWAVGERILDDRHFVFRGGLERTPDDARRHPADGGAGPARRSRPEAPARVRPHGG